MYFFSVVGASHKKATIVTTIPDLTAEYQVTIGPRRRHRGEPLSKGELLYHGDTYWLFKQYAFALINKIKEE